MKELRTSNTTSVVLRFPTKGTNNLLFNAKEKGFCQETLTNNSFCIISLGQETLTKPLRRLICLPKFLLWCLDENVLWTWR